MAEPLLLRSIVHLLPRFRYRFNSEVELHVGIASVLSDAGILFDREFVAGPQDRFDFLVRPDGIVIEAKIKGSLAKALPQIRRYAARDDVRAVVLVSTRHWGGVFQREFELHHKPVRSVRLESAAF